MIGCPAASIVVSSVLMKRSNTAWTSGGSEAVTAREYMSVCGGEAGQRPSLLVPRLAGQRDPRLLAAHHHLWLHGMDLAAPGVIEEPVD